MRYYLILLTVLMLSACDETNNNSFNEDNTINESSSGNNSIIEESPSDNSSNDQSDTESSDSTDSAHSDQTDADSSTTDENAIPEPEAIEFYAAFDNMGRPINKEFEDYSLEVVSSRKLKEGDKTSKDTIAVYGKINRKNTQSLLKVNSYYNDTDEIKVNIYKNGQLISSHQAKAETNSENVRYFGDISIQ